MTIDTNKIRFIRDGEPTAQEVQNRPTKDLIKEIDMAFSNLSLGGNATLVADFDTIGGNGFFTNGSNGAGSGSPDDQPDFLVIHVNLDQDDAVQIGFSDSIDGKTYRRTKDNGSWSGWHFFYSSIMNYGLGVTYNPRTADIKSLRGSSFEYQHPAAPNKVGSMQGALINVQPDSNYALQIAYIGNDNFVMRGKYNGVWSQDLKVFHEGNSINPKDFGIGGTPKTTTNWEGIGGGSFISADGASNSPSSDGLGVTDLMTTTYRDLSGDYRGVIGLAKNSPRAFGISSGDLSSVGWDTEWFEFYTSYNQNVVVSTSIQCNNGFSYYVENNSTLTLPTIASEGDYVRFRKAKGSEPRIKSPTGVNIIIGRDSVLDNEIIYDIDAEIVVTFNGTNWEI